MAKFNVEMTVTTTKTIRFEWKVTKAQVVEELSLEGDERADWKSRVQEIIETQQEEIQEALSSGTLKIIEEEQGDEEIEITSVEDDE